MDATPTEQNESEAQDAGQTNADHRHDAAETPDGAGSAGDAGPDPLDASQVDTSVQDADDPDNAIPDTGPSDAGQPDTALPAPVCGNGLVEDGELCDGTNCIECLYFVCDHFRNVENTAISSQDEAVSLEQDPSEDCSTINGNLHIGGTVNDSAFLASLRAIVGGFYLTSSFRIETLNGLQSLEYIGGDFWFYIDRSIENLQPLSSLRFLGGTLLLYDGPGSDSQSSLASFNGLNALTSIGGDLRITQFENLFAIDGFRSLVHIGGALEIQSNPALLHIGGFDSLVSVGSHFGISYNDSLLTLGEALTPDGSETAPRFQQLESVGANFNLTNNPLVSTCEIKTLRDRITIDGEINIRNNLDDTADCPFLP